MNMQTIQLNDYSLEQRMTTWTAWQTCICSCFGTSGTRVTVAAHTFTSFHTGNFCVEGTLSSAHISILEPEGGVCQPLQM